MMSALEAVINTKWGLVARVIDLHKLCLPGWLVARKRADLLRSVDALTTEKFSVHGSKLVDETVNRNTGWISITD